MKAAFAGSFAGSIIEPVRTRLSIPCDLVADDEARILRHLPDTDILVSMAFTAQMAEVAPNLRLVQVPGAGLDRIERVALRPGVKLANAYGHDTGIAEYIIGGMIALTRSFARLDASLRQGRWDSQWAVVARRRRCGPNLPARPGNSGLRTHRSGAGPARGRIRNADLRNPTPYHGQAA